MKPLPPDGGQGSSQKYMNGVFLEKPGLLAQALKREEEWSVQVPGYNPTMERTQTPMGILERSLYKLQAEREMGMWAKQFVDPNAPVEDDGNDGNMGRPIEMVRHATAMCGTSTAPILRAMTIAKRSCRKEVTTSCLNFKRPM